MQTRRHRVVIGLVVTVAVCGFSLVMGHTDKRGSLEGWEKNSPYNF